jgi:predicted Zn-dependent protease
LTLRYKGGKEPDKAPRARGRHGQKQMNRHDSRQESLREKRLSLRRCIRILCGTMQAAAVWSLLATALPQDARAQGAAPVLLRDQEIEDALHVFSRPVFEQAGLSPQTVRFILVQNDALNAFVAGGQNIFVHTGLILETDTPDELVGVIAHETGHIASGHLFRTREAIEDASLQALIAQVVGIAAAIGARSGEAGMAAAAAGATFAQRNILRHSRVQESSADQAGLRYLQDARLPVEGLARFMEKLAAQELLPESQQSEYVRTHPLTRDRIDFLQDAIARQRRPGSIPPEWNDLHARMKAKIFGYLFPERAVRDTDTSVPARYGRAIALYRRAQTKDALALLDQLIGEEPKNPWFLELKGQILFESGRIEESLAPLARAAEYAPHSGLIRTAYAHALLETRENRTARTQQAAEELQRALRAEPRSAHIHRLLATAYGRQGKEGLSRVHLAEQAALRGDAPTARREATLAQRHLPEKSAAWLRAQDILDLIGKKDRKKD